MQAIKMDNQRAHNGNTLTLSQPHNGSPLVLGTQKYNRRNNPELEKRRIHHCDFQGKKIALSGQFLRADVLDERLNEAHLETRFPIPLSTAH